MSTVPDLRDIPIAEEAIIVDADDHDEHYDTRVGYVCATVIVIAMMYFDGWAAVMTAGACASTLCGVTAWRRSKR